MMNLPSEVKRSCSVIEKFIDFGLTHPAVKILI